MRFIISILFILTIFSCVSFKNENNDVIENNYFFSTNEDGTVSIIGRIEAFGLGGGHPSSSFMGIRDPNENVYIIYPRSVGEELKGLQGGHTIKFTAILVDEPQRYPYEYLHREGRMIVTPISWEIIMP